MPASVGVPPPTACPSVSIPPLQYANCGTLKKLLLNQMINPTKKLFSLEVDLVLCWLPVQHRSPALQRRRLGSP